MEFLNQILKEAGADTLAAFTVVPSFGAYFKSVRGVAEYTPSKIVIRVGKSVITVTGEKLCIGEYGGGDLFVRGDVSGVAIE